MELAIHCANLSWPGGPSALGDHLARVARAADEGGVTTLTLSPFTGDIEERKATLRTAVEALELSGVGD